jgi:hypothetical protein
MLQLANAATLSKRMVCHALQMATLGSASMALVVRCCELAAATSKI